MLKAQQEGISEELDIYKHTASKSFESYLKDQAPHHSKHYSQMSERLAFDYVFRDEVSDPPRGAGEGI